MTGQSSTGPLDPAVPAARPIPLSRRRALRIGAMGLVGAGAAVLFGCGSESAGERRLAPGATPEVTKIRVPRTYTACMAPLLFAEDYLREDGIAVEYVTRDADYILVEDVAAGKIDIGYYFVPHLVHAVDAGLPIALLGGAHTSCFQIIATPGVDGLRDLRGRRVGFVARDPRPGDRSFVASILQRIGIRPDLDVELVAVKPTDLLTALGTKVDAIHTYATFTLQLRDTGWRNVLIDSATDATWSENLCCCFFARREFVEKNPVATNAALRAMLRSVDHGMSHPGDMAARWVERGWVNTEEYAVRTLDETRFDTWRSHSVEDAIRFYGLKLLEAGLIKKTPEEIIERGTDLRFFNDLKQELALAPGQTAGAYSFNCNVEPGAGERSVRAVDPDGTRSTGTP